MSSEKRTGKEKTDVMRDGYCICCPKCSKMNTRSLSAESQVVCERCGYRFNVYVKRHMIILSDMGKAEEERLDSWMEECRAVAERLITGKIASRSSHNVTMSKT